MNKIYLHSEFADAKDVPSLIDTFKEYLNEGNSYVCGRCHTTIDIPKVIRRLEYLGKQGWSLEEIYSQLWNEMC